MSDGRRIGRPGRVIHSFYGGEVRQYEDPRRVEVLFDTRHWSPSHVTTTGARSQMGVAVGGEQWAAFVKAVTSSVEEAHETRLYEENARGGEARGVVADVARILGTDIDAGTGHRWDADHMRRVVVATEWLRDDRNHWEAIAGALEFERDELAAKHITASDLLRSEKERADAAINREETAEEHASEIGQYARRMEQERDAERAESAKSRADAAYWRHSWEEDKGPDVDELKATIVSQAREIARLKGESA
jgi:hypothetical protein